MRNKKTTTHKTKHIPYKSETYNRNEYEMRPKTSIMSVIGESMASGFGFGMGNMLTRTLFGATTSTHTPQQTIPNTKNDCETYYTQYEKCIQDTNFECEKHIETYKRCIDTRT